MKKILILILFLFSFNGTAISKETNFNNEIFEKSQLDGKTVVIHSWNKTCVTCAAQVIILDQAKQDFKDVLFLYIEHVKNKDLVKELNINFWSTIAVYKHNKEVAKSVGMVDKNQIYTLIEKGI